MRSCPLRTLFEASPGYERRLGFAARVGIALHVVLRSFSERPVPASSPDQAAVEARLRFDHELHAQMVLAGSRPRERGLPREQSRIDRAAEAVVMEALRVLRADSHNTGAAGACHQPCLIRVEYTAIGGASAQVAATEVEVPVASRDGLFCGRVDRVEHRSDGTWLFDYKSGVRDELPERYERQLQLYAFMWHDVRREWPVKAQVLYPLTTSLHQVCVEPEVCQQVAAQSAKLICDLQHTASADRLATPGAVCGVCDFRPWCEPFWRWQTSEQSLAAALEKAVMGFTGQVRRIGVVDYYWRVAIDWRNAQIQLSAPQERFPQLAEVQVGQHLRVLDTKLRGLRHQSQASVTPLSEVFVVTQPA